MPHVQHTFRLDAGLSDRFVRLARALHLKKVEAFRQAVSDWNREAAKFADDLEAVELAEDLLEAREDRGAETKE